MIINFSFKNYSSFKEEQSFSLIAAPIKERFEASEEDRIIKIRNLKLLKSAVIYGSNASGKSNFLNAIRFFKEFIFSIGIGAEDKLSKLHNNLNRFMLDDESIDQPSIFELSFEDNDIVYRYGFELDSSQIVEEWLYRKVRREALVFYRTIDGADISSDCKVMKEVWKKKMVRKDALLLTVAAQFNDSVAVQILDFIKKIKIVQSVNNTDFKTDSFNLIQGKSLDKKKLIDLLSVADFGIVELENNEEETLNSNSSDNLYTIRKRFDSNGAFLNYVKMNFDKYESEGTKKFFYLLGVVLDCLKEGKVLVVDELDSQLHPLLIRQIVSLFHDVKINANNAQLIFTTHNVNLLEANIFRRDQIWFTEKDRFGATVLFALTDFKKGVRNDEKISKRYLEGRYGAIPNLADFIDYLESKF